MAETTLGTLEAAGVLVINDGYRTKRAELAEDGVPILRVAEVHEGRITPTYADHVSEDHRRAFASKVSSPGDVVVTTKGTVGRVVLMPEGVGPFVYSPQLCFFRVCDPNALSPNFLFSWFRSEEFKAQAEYLKAQTDMADYINLRDIRSLRVTLPEPDEQRAIAGVLGAIDDKIEVNRRMAETLEEMARALFRSWFVDFDPVRAKAEGRDTGLPSEIADLFPDRLVDSDLGAIPDGWSVEHLGDHAATTKGRSYRSHELTDDSTTAMVTLKSFERGGGYRDDGLKPFVGPYKPDQVVMPGDLVIACTDVTQAAEVVGRPALIRSNGRYAVLVASLDALVLRPRTPRVTVEYLYRLAQTKEFTAHTYAHTSGTTVLHLAKEAVPGFRFALPPSDLVDKFTKAASLLSGQRDLLGASSRSLAELRDALLPKLVSGEVRISDPVGFVERLEAVG